MVIHSNTQYIGKYITHCPVSLCETTAGYFPRRALASTPSFRVATARRPRQLGQGSRFWSNMETSLGGGSASRIDGSTGCSTGCSWIGFKLGFKHQHWGLGWPWGLSLKNDDFMGLFNRWFNVNMGDIRVGSTYILNNYGLIIFTLIFSWITY